MKKIVSLLVGLLILPLSVGAKSNYWQDYFTNEEPTLKLNGTCDGVTKDNTWGNKSKGLNLYMRPICHEVNQDNFNKELISENLVLTDTENLTAKVSNENVIKVEIKDYDFSEEKKYFEEYKSSYEEKPLDENKTWWEYNGFTSEPETWYEAYGYQSEPQNAHEVILHGIDLGKTKITLSATGKEDMTIDYYIKNDVFYINNKEGLLDVLEDFESYKDVFPLNEAYEGVFAEHNMVYEAEDDEDLSDIINALKGKDISIHFTFYKNDEYAGYYGLNGKDILEDVDKGFTYYYETSLENSVKKEEIKKLLEAPSALYLDFTYHGKLPAPYKTTVSVSELVQNYFIKKNNCQENDDECLKTAYDSTNEYLENGLFTLLYYNEEENKMEVVIFLINNCLKNYLKD